MLDERWKGVRLLVVLVIAALGLAGCAEAPDAIPPAPTPFSYHEELVVHEQWVQHPTYSFAAVSWIGAEGPWPQTHVEENQTIERAQLVLRGNATNSAGEPKAVHFEVGCVIATGPCGDGVLAAVDGYLPLSLSLGDANVTGIPGQGLEYRFWLIGRPDVPGVDTFYINTANLTGTVGVREDPTIHVEPWVAGVRDYAASGHTGPCVILVQVKPDCRSTPGWSDWIAPGEVQMQAANFTLTWDPTPIPEEEMRLSISCYGTTGRVGSCPGINRTWVDGTSPLHVDLDLSKWPFGAEMRVDVRQATAEGFASTRHPFELNGTIDYLVPPGRSAGPDRGDRS